LVGVSAALHAESLYRFFRAGEEETLALRGVSLEVLPGHFVALVGPSGSGKSTLMSCLAGIDEPDGGTVHIADHRMSHQSEPVRARLRARRIGLLFQSANLIGHLSVRDNVRLAQRLADRKDRPEVPELLTTLGIESRSGAYPGQLSGGETARAGLAVALANRPAVLLADEPTGELDAGTEEQVLQIFSALAAAGVAILVASHSPAVAAAADRVITISDGALV
jgi:putative ABC transport system ATP-binding protein